MLELQRNGRKKNGEDLNENDAYNKESNSNLFSYCGIVM